MRAIPWAVLALGGCKVIDPFPFVDGLYVEPDHDELLEVRVDDELLVFYELSEVTVDSGGAVTGPEDHTEPLHPFLQEERCGDGLWYEAANLDSMVTFQLGTTFFAWPYLAWDCDQEHLMLSEHQDALACDDLNPCWRFEPYAE